MSPVLPFELIQEIGTHLGNQDRQHGRLTCSRWNQAMEPQLFSRLTISVRYLEGDSVSCPSLELLQAVAGNKTNISRHIRQLAIQSLRPRYDFDVNCTKKLQQEGSARMISALLTIRTCLEPAIRSMTGLHSVCWSIRNEDLAWTRRDIIRALTSLNSLANFQLLVHSLKDDSFQDTTSFPLHDLHDLQSVSIRSRTPFFSLAPIQHCLFRLIANSPNLHSLTLDHIRAKVDTEFVELSNLFEDLPMENLRSLNLVGWTFTPQRPFKSLTTLHVPGHVDPNLWKNLQRQEIFVTELASNQVNSGLVEYMASYSGIEVLLLSGLWQEAPELSEDFYNRALGKHRHSLRELALLPAIWSRWCFGKGNAEIVAQCHNLRRLSLTLDYSTLDDSIILLLDSLHRIPGLQHLDIQPPLMFDPSWQVLNRQIAARISEYGPIKPGILHPSLTVCTNGQTFRLTPHEIDGERGFRFGRHSEPSRWSDTPFHLPFSPVTAVPRPRRWRRKWDNLTRLCRKLRRRMGRLSDRAFS
ncbi:hypothetical protein C8J56DRAFT_329249 [Mycena floridula]|nr:hypothetical protein C8J56DRAFT_329249 [Mycena floridula]